MIAKSITIKRRGGRSSGCVVKAVRLTSGDLHPVPASGLGKSQDFLTTVQKSAEGKVGKRQARLVRHCNAERRSQQIGRAATSQTRRPERCPQGLNRQDE